MFLTDAFFANPPDAAAAIHRQPAPPITRACNATRLPLVVFLLERFS
jgi:hypothetical protein